ncbi:uncharacterized protein TNCV_1085301 [Trichonephila clavipes]|nr:uncharacterized protein TNCV_1085301 [Trichonephila clavipes]
MSSRPVPLKTCRVGQRCTLILSRGEASSCWCGVVVRRGGVPAQVSSTSLDMVQIPWSVAKSPRVAEQFDVNIHSPTHSFFPYSTSTEELRISHYTHYSARCARLS